MEEQGIRRWRACPVCADSASKPYVTFETVEFVRCAACRVVYKSLEDTSIRERGFYERGYFHDRKSARERRFERRVANARRQILSAAELTDARRVLDVGCSLGYGIEAALRLGLEGTGTDVSDYAVRACRERGYHAEVASLEKLPFDNAAFDVILMRHVLEHTPDPRLALAEAHRVASPGGVVVVAVPNLAYWKGLLRRRSYRYFRPDDLGRQHYVYYTAATLGRLLETAGFEVVARSKAIWRRRLGRRTSLHAAWELTRFVIMLAWQGLARAFWMRREIVLIGRRP